MLMTLLRRPMWPQLKRKPRRKGQSDNQCHFTFKTLSPSSDLAAAESSQDTLFHWHMAHSAALHFPYLHEVCEVIDEVATVALFGTRLACSHTWTFEAPNA